jgi:hypothetical protein
MDFLHLGQAPKQLPAVQHPMGPGLPWARWIIQFGHPVGVTTRPGVLIAADDGNIYVTCAKNRAYAIEVFIKPEFVKEIISQTPTAETHGCIYSPWVLGYATRLLLHEFAEQWDWKSPSALMRQLCSASKQDGNPVHLRTNVGLETFDNLILDDVLDLEAWNTTSIPLEIIS